MRLFSEVLTAWVMQQQSLSVPMLTLLQTQEISTVNDYLPNNSMVGEELTSSLEEEALEQLKREYFQDQYLYADKIWIKQEKLVQKLCLNFWSLRELSITASNFDDTLSVTCEDENFVKNCQEYIADATADRVDGYSFVASYKEAEIAAPQEKRSKLLELLDEIVYHQQQELEMLKISLLKMHKPRLIGSKLIGKTRTISIQPSPPKIAQLYIDPNAPEFPE